MHPCLFGQMHLAIWTNTIGNLDKYNDQFREIHLAFCFAFSKYQGCACLQPPTSLNAALLTHRAISPRTLSATAINFLSHSQRGKYTHTHILSEHCQVLSMRAQILKYCQKPNIRSDCAMPVTILMFWNMIMSRSWGPDDQINLDLKIFDGWYVWKPRCARGLEKEQSSISVWVIPTFPPRLESWAGFNLASLIPGLAWNCSNC